MHDYLKTAASRTAKAGLLIAGAMALLAFAPAAFASASTITIKSAPVNGR